MRTAIDTAGVAGFPNFTAGRTTMNLTPEQRSFVDAVVKPLGDDDSRRELLEESLVLATTLTVPPEGDPVEVAAARMEATAGSFSFRLRLTRTISVVAISVTNSAGANPTLMAISAAASTNGPAVPAIIRAPPAPGRAGMP